MQPARELNIRAARFGDAGRVIVGEDNGGRVELQGAAHNLARVDAGPVDGAAKQLLKQDHPVPVVQKQAGEDLLLVMPQPAAEEAPRGIRMLEDVIPVQLFLQMSAGQFQYRLQVGVRCLPETVPGAKLLPVGIQQCPQPAEICQ